MISACKNNALSNSESSIIRIPPSGALQGGYDEVKIAREGNNGPSLHSASLQYKTMGTKQDIVQNTCAFHITGGQRNMKALPWGTPQRISPPPKPRYTPFSNNGFHLENLKRCNATISPKKNMFANTSSHNKKTKLAKNPYTT